MIVPSRADGTLLPALLALLLAVLAAVQLAIGPEAPPAERYGRIVVPAVQHRAEPPVVIDPVILRAAIFTPGRGSGGDGAPPAPLGPLGDAAPVGITRTRGGTRVILQRGDGAIIRLAIGARYREWRLIGVTSDAVRFAGPGGSVQVPLADRPISTGQYALPPADKR